MIRGYDEGFRVLRIGVVSQGRVSTWAGWLETAGRMGVGYPPLASRSPMVGKVRFLLTTFFRFTNRLYVFLLFLDEFQPKLVRFVGSTGASAPHPLYHVLRPP